MTQKLQGLTDHMISIAAVVVWFNPTSEQRTNVEKLLCQFGLVVVVDNTPVADIGKSPPLMAGMVYMRNYNHGGIAQALNIGIVAASNSGATYVALFDQDSVVQNNFLQKMRNHIIQTGAEYLFPAYRDINSGERAAATIATRWGFRKKKIGHSSFDECLVVLTSGSVIKSSCIQDMGPFRVDFFIDHVDTEFCIRMLKCGRKIRLCADVDMDHALGDRTMRKFLGITLKPYNYNSFRTYFRVRNSVILIAENLLPQTGVAILLLRAMAHELIAITFLETDRAAKIKSFLRGFRDGLLRRPAHPQ